jgi:uncharacterized protein (TIGR02145 family)/prepilin-type N-terminal cleavage/methylation domain-containing protein
MLQQNKNIKRGFTFIELLIVMGLIAILVAMVIFIAKPGERFLKARDDHRQVELNAIWHAVEEKIDQDNGGWANCDPIPEDYLTLIGSSPAHYDLYSCIVSDHLETPLVDPLEGYYNDENDYNTYYRIWRNPVTGAVSLRGEGETRLVYSGDPEPPLRLVDGEECDIGSDCESGYCVDGYCCDTACTDTCWACDVTPGTCMVVSVGTPDSNCSEEGVICVGSCSWTKYDGMCDGAGSCRIVQEDIPLGYVCIGEGNKVEVSLANYCVIGDEELDCNPDSCTGTIITPYFSCAAPCQWCQGEGQGDSAFQFYDERGAGQAYQTVLISTQCWMAQSMNVGTRIDGSVGQGTNCESIDKYCYNDSDSNCTSNNPNYPDGGLYQWNQAMCGSVIEGAPDICPVGWHIPTNAEWVTLAEAVGENPGTKLQPGGDSGFEGNLAGHRNLEGSFAGLNDYAALWSSTQYNDDIVWYRSLYQGDSNFYELLFDKLGGFSVRCLRDSS